MLEGIEQYAGVGRDAFQSLESAKAAMGKLGLDPSKETQVGGIIEKIMEQFVQPKLIEPTFLTDFRWKPARLPAKCPQPTVGPATRR
jgi:lysyl-tRNA synthetase class 2